MDAAEAAATGAGLLYRLRRHAGDVLFFGVALVVGFFLWPTSLGGCTTLTIVSGHSMEPTYYTGDLVVSRCGDYNVGDVVVYTPPDVGSARVIHRLIGGDSNAWVIQGDNNDFIDPWNPTDDAILGRAIMSVPKVGLLGTVVVSPVTWVSLLLVAGALIIWPSKPGKHVRPDDDDVTAPDSASAVEPATADAAQDSDLSTEIFEEQA